MEPLTGYSEYYRHLIFDNSLTHPASFNSSARAVAPSWIEAWKGNMPIDEEHFISPPNSLRLSWIANTGGDWLAEVYAERWRGRELRLEGSLLSFWLRGGEAISADALPALHVHLSHERATLPLRLGRILGDLPAGVWIQARIPFSVFPPATGELDFSRIDRVVFSQSIDDGIPHTLLIDEIRVLPESAPAQPARLELPAQLDARGFDRHVDLTWGPANPGGVLYYLIYRSLDGAAFEPVGIQNPAIPFYSDFCGLPHGARWYRLAAVGFDYREQPVGLTAQASTRPFRDEELLDRVQDACFRYYWHGAHPLCGMARECIPGDEDLIALGASGFGILAVLSAVERGFVSRAAGLDRLERITAFLSKADRFHGAWPHFLDGRTGRAIPWFGKYDNGGDLVETAFLIQGLLAARQFFDRPERAERALHDRITGLWEEVEWDWYRGGPDPDFLYWHWSPGHGFHIDHPLIGWNETLIAYLLAIASPTHPVPAELFTSGWASSSPRAVEYRQNWGKTTHGDHYTNAHRYYGTELPVGVGSGGPLFFTHYSFMGFDPRGIRDRFTNYFKNNQAIARINHAYCAANPLGFEEYSADAWGLTASDDHSGYLAHEASPHSDNGTLSPTGALASFPYTPQESMRALKHFYYERGEQLWDFLGFRDAYNPTVGYVSPIFMGLNQAPICVMIENQRSGLLWRLFMANEEIRKALEGMGFVKDKT